MAGRSIGKAPDIAYIGGNLRKGLAMNIAATVIPDRDDAVAALDTLRAWARKASAAEIETLDPSLARLLQSAESYPQFSRDYPSDFAVGDNYKATLPCLLYTSPSPRDS